MSEYKVKFKARVKGLFGPSFERLAIYEAESAKEATEACKADFWAESRKSGEFDEDDVEFKILDVEAV